MGTWTDPVLWDRVCAGTDCRVCASRAEALVELEASWVIVGPDDPINGYACLVFYRHAIELHDLDDAESAALMRDMRRVSAAIASLMRPVKMNYEIHGNTAPHLHIHFFPRYRGDSFEGRPIDPRAVRRPVYGEGEFDRFARDLRSRLSSGA